MSGGASASALTSGIAQVPSAPRRDVAISVVLPTYRRPDLLARCLDALCRQTLEATYEIVVADDDPLGPRSLEVCLAIDAVRKRYPYGPAIHYLPIARTQGPAGARNTGWRVAHGRVVAFTDDDTIPDRDWLAAGLASIATGLDAVGGRITMPLPDAPTDYERDAAGLGDAEFATANCLVTREALMAVGGFDERFTSAWREDSDLHFSLVERGFAVGRSDDAIVVHPIRPERRGVSIAQQRKALFDALLFKKHPALVRERMRVRAPWHYYASVASLAIAIAAACFTAWTIAGIAFATYLALALRFAWRRLDGTSHDAGHVVEMIATSLVLPPLSIYWRARGAWRFRVAFL